MLLKQNPNTGIHTFSLPVDLKLQNLQSVSFRLCVCIDPHMLTLYSSRI